MKTNKIYTYNSAKLFKREMFDGMGPSRPVACISLQSFKFKRMEIRKWAFIYGSPFWNWKLELIIN